MLTFHLGLCCQNLSLEPNFLRRNAAAQAALALGMKDIIEAQRLLWPGAPVVVVQQTEEERWLGGQFRKREAMKANFKTGGSFSETGGAIFNNG